jgi:predicted glycosyltransferase
MKTIWIDLDNTPHIPFFRPIIAELNRRGYQVKLTARDAYQVCDLADYFQMKYLRIGRHYGKSKIMKVVGSVIRAMQLIPAMYSTRPDLAVSHGSRTQLIAATLLGIPTVMIYDYEHAKALASIHPTWIMVPDVLPDSSIAFQHSRVYKYPGIKEDVYVPDFVPEPSLKGRLGIADESLLITIRPPATEAHYHSHKSEEMFEALIGYLVDKSNSQIVILPRNKKQEAFVREKWPELFQAGKLIIPEHAVDGLNLIWCSDLVISGGGTMNREAAALGVPVYSIFRGKLGAVDNYLAESGRLIMLESTDDFDLKIKLTPRDRSRTQKTNNVTLQGIVDKIVVAAEIKE